MLFNCSLLTSRTFSWPVVCVVRLCFLFERESEGLAVKSCHVPPQSFFPWCAQIVGEKLHVCSQPRDLFASLDHTAAATLRPCLQVQCVCNSAVTDLLPIHTALVLAATTPSLSLLLITSYLSQLLVTSRTLLFYPCASPTRFLAAGRIRLDSPIHRTPSLYIHPDRLKAARASTPTALHLTVPIGTYNRPSR